MMSIQYSSILAGFETALQGLAPVRSAVPRWRGDPFSPVLPDSKNSPDGAISREEMALNAPLNYCITRQAA